MSTGIEWTDETWNPLVGCKAVSPGCDHCYAATQASTRLAGVPVYAGLAKDGVFTGEVRCLPERLDQPLRWRKPRRIFVNSMSDLFHGDVPDGFIAAVVQVMNVANQHTFQVLTKRPQRQARLLSRISWDCNGDSHLGVYTADELGMVGSEWYDFGVHLPNVWWGTSIENDKFTFRANHLRATPAAVRFLSLEPLLGPLPSLDLTGIDWVIVGGESGHGARPMHPQWARDVRDRCVEAGVPFLFKQWGEWAPGSGTAASAASAIRHGHFCADGRFITRSVDHDSREFMSRVGKKAAGRTLDGRIWDEYPA